MTEEQSRYMTSSWHRYGTLLSARIRWTSGSFIPTELSNESINHTGSVRVALRSNFASQFHAVMTALLPALQEVGHVEVKRSLPSSGLFGSWCFLELAVTVVRFAADPDWTSNVGDIGASQMETADRLVASHDACMPLLASLLGALGSSTWSIWHDWPRGELNGRVRLIPRIMNTLCRGTQYPPLAQHDLIDHVGQIMQEMPPISDLQRLQSTDRCRFDVALSAIPRNDVDLWLLLEPDDDRRWIAVWQQIHDAMVFQVDDDRAVAVATPPSPVINSHDPRRCMRRQHG